MRGGAPLEAVATLRRLADRALAADDAATSAGYLLEASFAHMFRGEMHALAELAAEARDRAGAAAPEVAALASIAEGEALLALGRAREGDALLAAAEPLLFAADPLSDVAEVVGMAAMCSLWVEQFDRTDRIVARMVDVTRAAGAAGRLVYPLTVRSQLHWRRGRWTQAYADAEESARLAAETGQHGARALALAQLARAEAGLGRIEQARAHGQAGVELSDRAAGAATTLHSLAALGFTELTAGHADAALAALERADAIDRDLPLGEPALTLYAPDLVEALVRSGRRDDASAALARLEQAAARTGGAWAEAVAARGRLLLADESELDAHGAAALAAHARVPMPFERARTELVLGERLRRARRRADARAHLQSAFDLLERLGAERWAERARMELIATGGRVAPRPPSAVEELTPHELQVALLVAEGRTNREVGAALFLSRKTIEHHLSAIYRKLDLRSRSAARGAAGGGVTATFGPQRARATPAQASTSTAAIPAQDRRSAGDGGRRGGAVRWQAAAGGGRRRDVGEVAGDARGEPRPQRPAAQGRGERADVQQRLAGAEAAQRDRRRRLSRGGAEPAAGGELRGDRQQAGAVEDPGREQRGRGAAGGGEGGHRHRRGYGAATGADDRVRAPRLRRRTRPRGAHGWLSTFSTRPLGSRTKKRRTPQGSSVRGWTISQPRRRAAAWAASTSSTSTETSGTTGALASSLITLSCAARGSAGFA